MNKATQTLIINNHDALRIVFRTGSNRKVFMNLLLWGENFAGGIIADTGMKEPSVFRAINELANASLIEKTSKRINTRLGGPHIQMWRVKNGK